MFPSVDMKAILAAEENARQLVKGKATASKENMKRSPTDHVPVTSSSSAPGPGPGSTSASAGPWRATMAPPPAGGNTSFGPPPGQIINTPPRDSTLARMKDSPRATPSSSSPAKSLGVGRPAPAPVQPTHPGLGPVITPSRQAPVAKSAKSGLSIQRQASCVLNDIYTESRC